MSRQFHRYPSLFLPTRTLVPLTPGRLACRHRAVLATTTNDMTSRHEAVPEPAETESRDLQQSSTGSLLRGYAVYSALSFPSFVDASPTLLKITTSIPVVKQVALFVVKNTFFKHFVAGETFQEAVPVVQSLRERNVAALMDYSVEVDEAQAKSHNKESGRRKKEVAPQCEKNIQEIMSSIPMAASLEDARNTGRAVTRKTWIAIKLTALLPSATSLKNFSSALLSQQMAPDTPFDTRILYNTSLVEPLTESDITDLKTLHSKLIEIADLAVKHQVRICVDAEHSWYQPAIDAFATDLMQRSNTLLRASPVNPVIYLTFQAYLRSTPARLRNAYVHAASNGYVLGAKLVRGAYHSQEIENHRQNPDNMGLPPPVWSEKHETDQCYNECAGLVLDNVSRPSQGSDPSTSTTGALFGTHNQESCDLIMDGLVKRGLATLESDGKTLRVPETTSAQVQLGQLFGMADALTNYVTCRLNSPDAPMVLKCIPYGKLEDVMPYLGRRAIENKSVLGNSNTTVERQRLSKELRRRIFH